MRRGRASWTSSTQVGAPPLLSPLVSRACSSPLDLQCTLLTPSRVLSAVHGKDDKDRVASVLINVLAALGPSMKARYVCVSSFIFSQQGLPTVP
jgi:hypothetical protein